MGIGHFSESMYIRSSQESLQAHLEKVYGIKVKQLIELDLGTFRVDRDDGPSWVARQFPMDRTMESVKGDARILHFLEQNGYPAERVAHQRAVSTLEEMSILVTHFVQGSKPKGSVRAFYFLGVLLGRLHSLPINSDAIVRKGGAWHHLSVDGGPREEIDAALSFYKNSAHKVQEKEQSLYETFLTELLRGEDFHDMPQALIHPDFVPVNMIKVDVGNWVVVDWAGAGIGPRIWSLGFLLWAAGLRDLQCVDAVVTGYRKYINLEKEELAGLTNAMGVRPVVFNCWNFCMGRKELHTIVQELPEIHDKIKAIARRAVQVFNS